MRFRTLRSLGLAAFLLILVCFGVSCESASAQEQSNSPVPPATSAGDVATPTASQEATPPATNAPAPKRVWTNDDMGDLHRNSTISTFVAPAAKPGKSNEKPVSPAKNANAKRYQDAIAAQRAKLPPIDDKIAQLKAVLSGSTVQQTRVYGGAHIDDWHEELVHLQKQRDDIETKISALQDEARHNGVPENQIPQ
jgi:hypothetical protein